MPGHHHHGHDHGHGHGDGTKRTVILNLAVNLGLTAAKWVAYALTGSPSLFGEAVHSTGDSFNPVFQWIGHRRGRRAACGEHPWGHGRETYFWSLLAALIMLVLGAGFTAWRGIGTIITGRAPEFSWVSLAIMGAALLAEGYTFTKAMMELRREGDGFLKRVRESRNMVLLGILLENFVDTIGVVLAFTGFGLFCLTGNPYFDAVCSLLIAAVIATSSLFLIVRNRSLLVGESLLAEELNRLAGAVCSSAWVSRLVSLTAVRQGQDAVFCRMTILADREQVAGLWSPDYGPISVAGGIFWTLNWQAAAADDLRRRLREADPRLTDIVIEIV